MENTNISPNPDEGFDEIIDKMMHRPGEIILEELIEQAFRIFASKLGHKGISSMTEYAFQFELGVILKTLGQLYEFKREDKFHLDFENVIIVPQNGGTKKSRVDILITYNFNGKMITAAIELKFFKKANHREPNNRYDVFKDIAKLEKYKTNGIDLCYFLLITDHEHYVHKENYASDTMDFDFRHDRRYAANTLLSYRTAKQYGQDISLTNDYHFNWRSLSDLYFLKLKVQ
jgi:hypothetical protein